MTYGKLVSDRGMTFPDLRKGPRAQEMLFGRKRRGKKKTKQEAEELEAEEEGLEYTRRGESWRRKGEGSKRRRGGRLSTILKHTELPTGKRRGGGATMKVRKRDFMVVPF